MASVLVLLLRTFPVGNGNLGLRSLATCLSFPKYKATWPLHPQVIRGTGVEAERWTDHASPVMKELLLLIQELNAVGLDFPFLLFAMSN